MAIEPLRNKPGRERPEIWASGGQRPPFEIGALPRASLFLAREGVAPLHAWAARTARRVAVNVKNGAGRMPADKLGRAERFVPSHLRVAAWIKNLGAALAHASATADPDVKRGNALVAEIAPHLWDQPTAVPADAPPAPTAEAAAAPAAPVEAAPVVLPEPQPEPQPEPAVADDPLAAIRDEMGQTPARRDMGRRDTGRRDRVQASGPELPPAPPGPVAEGVIQVSGYLIGWATAFIALPYGAARAIWIWVNGRKLSSIGSDD